MLLGFNAVGVCSIFSGVDLRLKENKSSHAREQTFPRSFLFIKRRACYLLTLNGTKGNLSYVWQVNMGVCMACRSTKDARAQRQGWGGGHTAKTMRR